jgi:hypothetical protein
MTDLDGRPNERPNSRINGFTYYWKVDESGLMIFDVRGDRLNPLSARVIMSLGGDEPSWYSVVHALSVAFDGFPERGVDGVTAAAEAISTARRNEVARTTSDSEVLRALGAYGIVEIGRNPICDEAAWDLLLNHREPDVKRRAYRSNDVLPPSLAYSSDVPTRVRVARNPECPSDILAKISLGDPQVRIAVGANPNATEATLTLLVSDTDWMVRQSVAANPNCPNGWITFLLRDRIAEVRVAMVSNPSVQWPTIARLVLNDPTPSVHAAAAARLELRPKELVALERYSRSDPLNQYRLVCSRLQQHPSCSKSLSDRIRINLERIDRNLSNSKNGQRNLTAQSLLSKGPRWWMIGQMLALLLCLLIDLGLLGGAIVTFRNGHHELGLIMLFAFVIGAAGGTWWVLRNGIRGRLGIGRQNLNSQGAIGLGVVFVYFIVQIARHSLSIALGLCIVVGPIVGTSFVLRRKKLGQKDSASRTPKIRRKF